LKIDTESLILAFPVCLSLFRSLACFVFFISDFSGMFRRFAERLLPVCIVLSIASLISEYFVHEMVNVRIVIGNS